MASKYDVVVIGGGPGGYTCAIRAAQQGLKVAVIESQHLGGICLNWGCIPTKALLKASETYHTIQNAAQFGIKTQGATIDIAKLIGRSRDISSTLNSGVGFLMKKNKIDVIDGFAYFNDKTSITVTKGKKKIDNITFGKCVIATGARARTIAGALEADGKNVWTYKEAMVPTELPKSLLVIGSGAIGVEFASFYNTFGTKVHVVEALDRILPVEDAEVADRAHKSFEKQGMTISTSAKVNSLKSTSKGVEAEIEINGKQTKQKFDKALVAIGVVSNIEGMNLDRIGLRLDRGNVKVNEYYQTNLSNIYAIGDVIGAPALAHVASHEGIITAEHISGKTPHTMDYNIIPGCTYCTPQVASVGWTEDRAKEEGRNIKVGRFDYQANGKALATGENEGLVKTIFDADSGELLGAHIIGAEATEMISTFVVAKQMEATEEDILNSCLPHPTLSEMIGESVLDSEGRVINA